MNLTHPHRVLIADDEENLRFVMTKLLRHEGCLVDEAVDGQEAIEKAEENPYDLYVFDLKMPRIDGMEALRRIRKSQPGALVVIMTAFGTQNLALEALQAGAYDYFTKPFELDELRIVLRRALDKQALLKQVQTLQDRLGDRRGFHRLIGESPAMKPVFELIRRVCMHEVTVLITGESGVGKEMVAAAIHENSCGKNAPFVKINCAAIPEPLLESELFGHEKGAFTGAVASKPGKFEMADGGSILLDEIGDMPLGLQAKLLRVIQEKQIERVGGMGPRDIDVRVMAATNRDLQAMVKEKTFREDLYFRINVLPVHIPPLRERREDIPHLAAHFLAKYARSDGQMISGITKEALSAIEAYSWPGNVRELDNVIQRAIVMSTGALIELDALPPSVAEATPGAAAPSDEAQVMGKMTDLLWEENFGSLTEQVDKMVEREEKRLILAALGKMSRRRQPTADLLGISRKSLHNKMQKYGLFEAEIDI